MTSTEHEYVTDLPEFKRLNSLLAQSDQALVLMHKVRRQFAEQLLALTIRYDYPECEAIAFNVHLAQGEGAEPVVAYALDAIKVRGEADWFPVTELEYELDDLGYLAEIARDRNCVPDDHITYRIDLDTWRPLS